MSPALKAPTMFKPKSVNPYVTPAARDYGQNFLYPGGYKGASNPANMNTWFTNGPGAGALKTTTGTYDQGESREQYTPLTDYGSLISGDWEVQDAEAAMGAEMARARGDFQAGLRQQLIDLGISDTSKLGSLGKYIDADTIKAAVANKYSATAQNSQAAERARAGNNAALAARGILNSGATTNAQQQVSAAQEAGDYQGLRSFLEGGASGLSGLGDMEYQLARGVAQARAAAAARAAEFGPGGDPTGFDQYGLSTDYSAYDPKAAAAAMAATRQMANQGLNRQIRSQTPRMLNQRQFMARNPRGVYANYLRAYRRQNPR